jgi:hypothetical protein
MKKRQSAITETERKRMRKVEEKDWLKEISEKEGDKWRTASSLFRSEKE